MRRYSSGAEVVFGWLPHRCLVQDFGVVGSLAKAAGDIARARLLGRTCVQVLGLTWMGMHCRGDDKTMFVLPDKPLSYKLRQKRKHKVNSIKESIRAITRIVYAECWIEEAHNDAVVNQRLFSQSTP
jgi:hypothetical protein